MALVVPNVGEVELLDKMLKDALSTDENYTLKLYTAISGTLDKDTIASDFTEATFTGYTSKTLTRSGWVSASTVSNKASSSYAEQSWVGGSGANETILGYYIIGATSTVLLWAEQFSSSVVVQETDTIKVTPVFTLNSE